MYLIVWYLKSIYQIKNDTITAAHCGEKRWHWFIVEIVPSVGVKKWHGLHVALSKGSVATMFVQQFTFHVWLDSYTCLRPSWAIKAYDKERGGTRAPSWKLERISAERGVMEGLQLSWKRRGWSIGKWDQFVLLLKVTWTCEAPPPSPRYHRFNCLELLLRSVTTKWLQRLRRQREPPERFMVGFLNPFRAISTTFLHLVAFPLRKYAEFRPEIWQLWWENIFSSAHFDINVFFAASAVCGSCRWHMGPYW